MGAGALLPVALAGWCPLVYETRFGTLSSYAFSAVGPCRPSLHCLSLYFCCPQVLGLDNAGKTTILCEQLDPGCREQKVWCTAARCVATAWASSCRHRQASRLHGLPAIYCKQQQLCQGVCAGAICTPDTSASFSICCRSATRGRGGADNPK